VPTRYADAAAGRRTTLGRIKPLAARRRRPQLSIFLPAVSLLDGEFGLAQFDRRALNAPKVCCALIAQLEIVPDGRGTCARRTASPARCMCGRRPDADTWSRFLPARLLARPLDARPDQKFNAPHDAAFAKPTEARFVDAVMALEKSSTSADLIEGRGGPPRIVAPIATRTSFPPSRDCPNGACARTMAARSSASFGHLEERSPLA